MYLELATNVLKKLEGFRPHLYNCEAGVPTIGYGFTKDALYLLDKEKGYILRQALDNKKISVETSNILLEDMAEYLAKKIVATHTVKLQDCQLAALISFCFNIGFNNYKSSSLYKQIELDSQSYAKIGNCFKLWIKEHNKEGRLIISDGLVKRREIEFNLYCGGI